MTMAAMAMSPVLVSCGEKGEPVSKGRLGSVGIQLYTVRDRMAVDLPGTLHRLAEIGYREVEFAGYFGHSPAEIATLLGNTGLVSPSTHTMLPPIRDTPEQLIESALAVGHDYVVLAWLPPEERISIDDYRRHAELMNQFAEQCQAAGLKFAYHNHDFEFESMDNVLPMDLLLAETDPQLVQMELDLYWIIKAGADPFAYFETHPGRFPLCHVKDMAEDGTMADVGSGRIDFAAVFAASELAGFRHYFVEHDDPPDSLASAANSFSAISKLEF